MGVMRRLAPLAALVLVCVFSATGEAAAATKFKSCGVPEGARCGRVSVPLDYSGKVAGRIGLEVQRYRQLGRKRRGALFALAGGPGQSGTLSFTEDAVPLLAAALRSRELVVYDQRGTGFSSLLRCPSLERADLLNARKEAADCAGRIGPKRQFFTTRDTVDDMEAVRRAIGVDKISIYGVSYGTHVALAYAATYPGHVERLVLDSTLDVSPPDPVYFDIYRATARVLRTLCRKRACRSVTRDPVGDLRKAVRKLASGPMRAYVVGRDGRRRSRSVDRDKIFSVLLAGDFDESLRADFPGAVLSMLKGDAVPMARLSVRASEIEGGEPAPREFSTALYATTVCEEGAFPWSRTAPFDERIPQARAFLAGLPDNLFDPWDRETAIQSDEVRMCERWPTGPDAPLLRSTKLPDVPTLILGGEDDMRTPLEGAERVAAALPHATLVKVPVVGHSVLGTDPTDCSLRAFRQFWGNRRISTRCGRPAREFPPTKRLPLSLSEVERSEGIPGKRGRTATAAALTLLDAENQADSELLIGGLFSDEPLEGGGLRGGTWSVGFSDIKLVRYELVPGVVVTGRGPFTGTGVANLRVRGRGGSRGVLNVRPDGRITGRLDGRAVRGVLPAKPFFEPAAAGASRARAAGAGPGPTPGRY